MAIFRRAGWRWLAGLMIFAAGGGCYGNAPTVRPAAAAPLADRTMTAARAFAALPLAFEPNQGQSDSRVRFLSRRPGYSLFLTAQGAVVSLHGASRPLQLTWQGANRRSEATGMEALPGKRNYLKGNNPVRWRRDIPTYGKVRYRDLYPGIDLVYYGRQRRLEYDLVVAPGADPSRIRLRLRGMDAMRLDNDGAVRLRIAGRSFSLSKPVIYQETAGGKKTVDGGYVLLADRQVGLKLAAYDRTRSLIIDPELTYSTYLGGGGADMGRGVAVDNVGNFYMVGQTASADFPLAKKITADTDVFVAKFDSTGVLRSVAILGGSGADRGFAIAADSSAVYVTGDTGSSDFPVSASPAQGNFRGSIDAFVAKLNSADLTLAYATYLGGSQAEESLGIAVDPSGNAYVAGSTLSNDFPVTMGGNFNAGSTAQCGDPSNPLNKIPCSDAFVVKYDPAGTKLYATYLGGLSEDAATAIAVNNAGEAYVTGVTYSAASFPTPAGFQSVFRGGVGDAFILKLDINGTVSYGSYLGGSGWDQGQAIALDNSGNIYITGATNSGDLPVTGVQQGVYAGGGYDAFVAKINPGASNQLQYLTYWGGSMQDQSFGIAVNKATGAAVVVGETMSPDFPVSAALQPTWFGGGKNSWGDGFVSEFNSGGFMVWSTYLGGSDDDWFDAVALDGTGGIYVAGTSFSSGFPTAHPYQSAAGANGDAILFKMEDQPVTDDLQVSASGAPDPVGSGGTLTYQVVVNNASAHAASGVVIQATLPGGVSFSSANPAGTCVATGAQVTCKLGDIPAGGSVTLSLAAVNGTAGNITFAAKVVRADQPYTDSTNNSSSASVTTIAALGAGGSGAWSWPEWTAGIVVYLLRRRRAAIAVRADYLPGSADAVSPGRRA